MRKIHLFLIGLILISACQTTKKTPSTSSSPTLLQVGPKEVSLEEFEYVYTKNNKQDDNLYSRESVEDYLDLYTKFKLKVVEAEAQGIDTTEAFKKEFEGYRKQLAKPYLTEEGFIENLAKEAYERMKTDVATSNIIISAAPDDAPSDTLKAYNKLLDIKKRIAEGEDFGEMAIKYSDDPSAQKKDATKGYKGYLGYYPPLSLVYEYENAAYNTPKGEVSEIFRSEFGYHILKVEDKQPSQGSLKAAHIMISAPDNITEEDSIQAHRKANELYDMVTGGDEWDKVCAQYSDHKPTRSNGGKLPEFVRGKLGLPSLEDAAFSLEEGEISKPVKSPYGWHIIKLMEKKPLQPYDEMKDELMQQVRKSPRAQLNKKVLVDRLKKENNFKANNDGYAKAISMVDSSITKGKWTYNKNEKSLKETLFTIEDKKYTIGDFFAYMEKTQKNQKSSSIDYAVNQYYDKYVNNTVYEYEKNHLEEKYVDYRMLLREYREGILLFELMDQEVWSKAVKDTSGLQAFYQENKSDYTWKKRAKATIYESNSKETLSKVINEIESGADEKSLLDKYNASSSLNLSIKTNTFEKGTNDIIDQTDWETGSRVIEDNNRFYYVVIEEVLPEEEKELEDARGIIISDYQNYLEEKWVKELREKYKVVVHDEQVKKIIQN